MYQRIVTALAEDIAAGRLRQGQALPTHRRLARALGVDLTTVTRAYAEARRQGLTEATVGRGTFVKGLPSPALRSAATPGIDLSMNLPPQPAEADLDARFAKALSDIRAESGLAAYLTYQQPGGTAAERQAAAEWLQALVPGITPDRLILAPGTQAALFCLLLAHAAPGDSMLTERLTYPGLKAAASAAGIRLIGLDMDEAGIVPAALDRAARAGAARLVYLLPTLHNPTTATMPAERRARIADIVRKRGLTLIEDDPYSFLAPGLAPLSTLIPERAYLAASLSKCIAPGLRTSLVVTPDAEAAARLAGLLRATLQMPAPLMAAVATRWMRDGTAEAIMTAVRSEAAARQQLAREALAPHAYAAHPSGHHIWLPLPAHWPAARFAAHLHGRGLAVVTGDAFATDAAPPNAIRLALGAARSRVQLAKALDILADALEQRAPDAVIV
ncbi:PLP-dependent aminotransferase family protein [Hyphomicrobium sp.]|uniref:aminotransferase-like domain-containing protein n=1 Tax=Hyphomicrobium sp. TaxID=82 RepID=UPI0025B9E7BF|nr:PLP-dependent aminotransferase family protein [Hyphomicrobium sp.]